MSGAPITPTLPMTKVWCLLALFGMMISAVRGDYSCVCNYDEDNPVLSKPDPQSSVIDHLYEFDCKPAFGSDINNYTGIQISHSTGYVSLQSNIQLQVCAGDASILDLVPTSTTPIRTKPPTTVSTTHMPTTITTTQMPTTIPTLQMPTTISTTQMPTTISTTQMPTTIPTTQMPTTTPTTQMPTTIPTTQMPTTIPTTQMPTTVSTTQMPTTVPTTQMPTTIPTSQMPTTISTTQMPTTISTTQMPTIIPTTQMPTTTPTTQMPTTIPTTQMPTTIPTTQMPTTVSTTQMPTTVPTTQMPTTVPSTQMPFAVSTTQMPTTVSTTQMPTTVPTTQMPTTVSTTQMPTPVSTTQMPTTVPTTHIRTSTSTTTTPVTTRESTTHSYHMSNVTNSILKYIGISYNLTNGNPIRGSETSSAMTDPGLLLGNRVFQINEYNNGTSREIEITSFPNNCTTKHALIHNGKSYQDEMLYWTGLTADHPQELLDNAFAFNKEFNKVRAFTEASQHTNMYQDVLTFCFQQKLRLKDELADTEPLSITRDFAKDACDLPEIYDVNEYVDFLDKWGTSIVVEAALGTKVLKRYQTTEPDIFELVNQKNPGLFHHSGAYMGYASSLTLSRTDYANVAQTFIPTYSGMASYRSNVGEMVPVGLKLVPITYAFDWKFWGNIIADFMVRGVCKDTITKASIQHMAENINKTLPQYFAIKNKQSRLELSPLTDSALKMPVTWPKGTYGLMKAANGCPGSHVTWHEGWRVQDSVFHTGIHHHFSPSLGNTLAGTFSNRIQTRYCMKTNSMTSPYDRDWPKGNYCILKKGNCPTGFSSGVYNWDDADVFNRNGHGGTLPDGSYTKNTKIYYCCRSDGAPSTAITLPIDRPFVLLRYRGTCQQVYGMSMREVISNGTHQM